MISLLIMDDNRMATDMPAWIIRFSHVLNHQKLKSMLNSSPDRFRTSILENVKQHRFFSACPRSFKKIFGLKDSPSQKIVETIELRSTKLNSLENVALNSIMLKHRLLYGTGFRADLISLAHVKDIKMSGKYIAKLLATADSTISRILSDLRACGFLDSENEMTKKVGTFPGMLLSTQSVWNFYELLDAEEYRENELKNAAYENLNFKQDKFCLQLTKKR